MSLKRNGESRLGIGGFDVENAPQIHAVSQGVNRLRPISSVYKIIGKHTGDPSMILDYEKEENKQSFFDVPLPEDLLCRFEELTKWRGWVKARDLTKDDLGQLDSPLLEDETLLRSDLKKSHRGYKEAKRREDESRLTPLDIDTRRYAIDYKNRIRLLKEGENPSIK